MREQGGQGGAEEFFGRPRWSALSFPLKMIPRVAQFESRNLDAGVLGEDFREGPEKSHQIDHLI